MDKTLSPASKAPPRCTRTTSGPLVRDSGNPAGLMPEVHKMHARSRKGQNVHFVQNLPSLYPATYDCSELWQIRLANDHPRFGCVQRKEMHGPMAQQPLGDGLFAASVKPPELDASIESGVSSQYEIQNP